MKKLYSTVATHTHDAFLIMKLMKPGTQLILQREPNPKHPAGIAIYREGKRLGFLPKSVCGRIAPMIDGRKFVICVKSGTGPTDVELTVEEA